MTIKVYHDGTDLRIDEADLLAYLSGNMPDVDHGLPVGGLAAQVLTKSSGADYDAAWAAAGGGGGASSISFTPTDAGVQAAGGSLGPTWVADSAVPSWISADGTTILQTGLYLAALVARATFTGGTPTVANIQWGTTITALTRVASSGGAALWLGGSAARLEKVAAPDLNFDMSAILFVSAPVTNWTMDFANTKLRVAKLA